MTKPPTTYTAYHAPFRRLLVSSFFTQTFYTFTLDGILPFSSPIPAAWFFFCSCFLRVFLEAGILFVVLKL